MTTENQEPVIAALPSYEELAAALSVERTISAELHVALQAANAGRKRKVDRDLEGVTHHFCINGHDGYLTVNFFTDRTPGEILLKMAKPGSTIAGLLDSFATAASRALQHGDTISGLCYKLIDQSYEPAGPTTNPDIPVAKSIVDYVFTYICRKFVPADVWRAYVEKKRAKIPRTRPSVLDEDFG